MLVADESRFSSARSWFTGLWLSAALILLLISLATNGTFVRYHLIQGPSAWGNLGAHLVRTGEPGQPIVVQSLSRASPLYKIGIREGDHLKLDRPWDDLRNLVSGENLGFTRIEAGKPQVHTLVTIPPAAGAARVSGFDGPGAVLIAARLSILSVGLFMLWRGRKTPSTILLGLAFLAYSIHPPFTHPLESEIFVIWVVFFFSANTLAAVLFLRFAMVYFNDNTQRLRSVENQFYYLLAAFLVTTSPFGIAFDVLNVGGSIPLIFNHIGGWLHVLTIILSIIYLVRGLVGSKTIERRRYLLLLVALPLTFCSVPVNTLMIILGASADPFQNLLDAAQIVGVMLFAYAVFREKLFNLGFAVNRVLVYGAFSVLILISFGLLEWVAEKFIHFEGRETNALLDAGLALLVFLIFHRARNFVEHNIEAVLFRSWHNNERALKTFVGDASSITRPEALAQAFLVELKRFSGGADAAYYTDAENNYALNLGKLANAPTILDANDPVVLPLRARRKPTEPSDPRFSASLTLPLLGYHDMQGFVLLSPKPSGDGFRPDEVEILGWAAHQIGAMLHALKIEQLESANRDLQMKYDESRTILASLRIASPNRPQS